MNANKQDAGGLLPCPGCGKSDLDHCPADFVAVNGLTRGMIVRCAWCHFAAPEAAWNRRELCRAAPSVCGECGGKGVVPMGDGYSLDPCGSCYAAPAGGDVIGFSQTGSSVRTVRDTAPAGSGEVEGLIGEWSADAANLRRNGANAPWFDQGQASALERCADNLRAALLRKLQQGADYVMVPREALRVEARRLRYRATETCGLSPQTTDAGAQMVHTAEALEQFASQGQEGGHARD